MRYYFHFRDKVRLLIDGEGTELLDLESAREEGRVSARELLGLDNGGPSPEYEGGTYEITDEAGLLVAVIEFDEAKLR